MSPAAFTNGGETIELVAIAAAVVTAVVTSAGTVGVALGTMALSYGASAATALTIEAVATAGCYAVAWGVAACASSDINEIITGVNPVRSLVFNGNQEAYDDFKMTLAVATTCIVYIADVTPQVEKQCFIAGTLVLTEDGTVNIENIEIGDMVWAENPETGEKALKQVVQVFINETNELVNIDVSGDEINATPTHPFYIKGFGWKAAKDLQAGDILLSQDGSYITVKCVLFELLDEPIAVYNFEVEDFHTYFVSNSSVLVHNQCDTAAMREAKRSENIPMSAKPTEIQKVKMIGANGRTYYAKTEIYGNKFIRNDFGGHLFKDGKTLPSHYNAGRIIDGNQVGNGLHFFYN